MVPFYTGETGSELERRWKNWGQREINWFVPVRREKIASLINPLQNQLI
jgi:hypothetical protein